jgi:hypothetical protein
MLNQLRTTVDAKVRFHTEEPLIAYLGLAYLRVVLFLLVLGRTMSADNRGIEKDALVDLKAHFLRILIDQVTQKNHWIVTPHEMTNIAYHHFIRFGLIAEVDVDKLPHGEVMVQCLISYWIGEGEPVMEKADA